MNFFSFIRQILEAGLYQFLSIDKQVKNENITVRILAQLSSFLSFFVFSYFLWFILSAFSGRITLYPEFFSVYKSHIGLILFSGAIIIASLLKIGAEYLIQKHNNIPTLINPYDEFQHKTSSLMGYLLFGGIFIALSYYGFIEPSEKIVANHLNPFITIALVSVVITILFKLAVLLVNKFTIRTNLFHQLFELNQEPGESVAPKSYTYFNSLIKPVMSAIAFSFLAYIFWITINTIFGEKSALFINPF